MNHLVGKTLRHVKRLLRRSGIAVSRLLPLVHNKVVFNNFNGRGFGDNPKYIAQELQGSGFELIWLTDKDRLGEPFPPYIKPVCYDTPQAWYHLCTARVLVSNVRNLEGFRKRKGQFYLQTWHGVMWFKRVEKDAEDLLTPSYVERAKLDGQMCDVILANNDSDEQLFRSSFWYSGPILRCGTPRLGPVVRRDPQLRARVYHILGLPASAKTVLFAPTFRDYDTSYVPELDIDAVLQSLNDTFGGSFSLLTRLHPNVPRSAYPQSPHITDVSDWPDVQEILAIADVLITDYSSICFDFVMGEPRPVYMFIPDMEIYLSSSRKPYHDLSETPFAVTSSVSDLCKAIRATDIEQYTIGCKAFLEMNGFSDDGNGARVVSQLIERCCTNDDLPSRDELEARA